MRFSTLTTSVLSAAVVVKAADHLIKVGDGGLAFNPTSQTIQDGDSLSFQFQGKNHSVTQSSFMNPCTSLPNGTDSGFMFVPPGATSLPQWTITINNASAPLWFYCAQVGHCEQGMVFAVNPTAEMSFDAFQTAAKAVTPPAGTSTGNTTTTANNGGAGSTNGTTNSNAAGSSSTDSAGSSSVPTAGAGGQPGSGGVGNTAATPNSNSTSTNAPSGALRLGSSAAGVLTTVTILVTLFL